MSYDIDIFIETVIMNAVDIYIGSVNMTNQSFKTQDLETKYDRVLEQLNSKVDLSLRVSILITKYFSGKMTLEELLINDYFEVWKQQWKQREALGFYAFVQKSKVEALHVSSLQLDLNILSFLQSQNLLESELGVFSIENTREYQAWEHQSTMIMDKKRPKHFVKELGIFL